MAELRRLYVLPVAGRSPERLIELLLRHRAFTALLAEDCPPELEDRLRGAGLDARRLAAGALQHAMGALPAGATAILHGGSVSIPGSLSVPVIPL